jgi:hypothetical protein
MKQELSFEETQQEYIDAAWSFAQSLLWPGEQFTDKEVRNVLADLQHYFLVASDLDEAFRSFCANVILALKNKNRCKILHPDLWLNPLDRKSLTAPNGKAVQMKTMLRKVPDFMVRAGIIAGHFLTYTRQPSAAVFMSCSRELEKIDAREWMGALV